MYTEPVLLINNDQPQVSELDILLEQRVSSDRDLRRARGQPIQHRLARLALVAAGEHHRLDADGFADRCDGFEMLTGENFRRRHDRALRTGLDGVQQHHQRDHRLSAADIALQQSQHAFRRAHVLEDFADRLFLAQGQGEGDGRAGLGDQVTVTGEAASGELAHAAADQQQG